MIRHKFDSRELLSHEHLVGTETFPWKDNEPTGKLLQLLSCDNQKKE